MEGNGPSIITTSHFKFWRPAKYDSGWWITSTTNGLTTGDHFRTPTIIQAKKKMAIGKTPFDCRDRKINELKRKIASINQSIVDLTEMAPCHHFAEQASNILRYLAKKSNIEIDMGVPEGVNREKRKAHQVRGEATRTSELTRMRDHDDQTRPATNSLKFFAPNMNDNDFITTVD
ncbi:hypothetical protein F5883DRAFT_655683 [Diaporthe sp. PMI_573]|nr:hypothetical protein F5883DRAFT_655683 [Diaporthaceae sp. PMI_573]